MLGFVAGPALQLVRPDEIFGDLLFPIISISVALILFEGGLTLRWSEIRTGAKIVTSLTTLGLLVTWVLAAAAAWIITDMSLEAAMLIGALLTVSGPTVIVPLLRQVRPIERIGSIIKWEGIINDPFGAILAVLVFEAILARSANAAPLAVALGALKALIVGIVLGVAGAAVIVILLRRYLVPDFLQNPVALMMVVITYLGADHLQSESGLLAVTIMGTALANQKFVSIRHILEFKENLRVLIISSLFIILAARLPVDQPAFLDWRNWLFVIVLIVLVRPAMVFLSTIGTQLNKREKMFLSWMAPRGIVAAAVSSVFALRLSEAGWTGFSSLVPVTFMVITGTVAVYGLTASSVARRLKVAKANPQGVLFAGAQPWVQQIALALKERGFAVALVDSNWANVTVARSRGLNTHYGNILSEDLLYNLPLDGIGRLFAMTPNDEVNSLAALHFVDIFSRTEVYQLPPAGADDEKHTTSMPKHLRGRYLFDNIATYAYLSRRFLEGGVVKRTSITEEYSYEEFLRMYGERSLPLIAITEGNALRVSTVDNPVEPRTGQTLLSVVDPIPEETHPKQKE